MKLATIYGVPARHISRHITVLRPAQIFYYVNFILLNVIVVFVFSDS